MAVADKFLDIKRRFFKLATSSLLAMRCWSSPGRRSKLKGETSFGGWLIVADHRTSLPLAQSEELQPRSSEAGENIYAAE